MAPPKLEARGLTRVVDGHALVEGVGLSAREGEVVAIAGPSGAGKSSLLRLLNRLDEPTAGVVLLDGEDYRRIPPRALRRRVGLVAQRPALWEGTALDNVTLGRRLRGEPVDGERARALLARMGVEDLASRDASRLSGGEAQRVALARALMDPPEVLLMDEPTAALDPETKAGVEALLAELTRELGLTGVLVTHDAGQARRVAHRVLRMERGRLTSPASEEAKS